MDNIYSQGVQDSYDGPYVVIIKNGLPMSDDDVQEDLEGMQKKFKELEANYNDLILSVETKHKNESRHETAKRYIVERENYFSGGSQNAPEGK